MTDTEFTNRRRRVAKINGAYIACPSCDALWPRPLLAEGERAICGRCHSVILTNKRRSAERTVALMTASLIVYVVTIAFPFIGLERSGISNEISVLDAVGALWRNEMHVLAVICACFILIFPLARIASLLFLGGILFMRGDTGETHARAFRLAEAIEPWTMAEIFIIGVIVSLVKVGKLADVTVGPAFWSMATLVVFLAMGASAVCRDTIWHSIRRTL